MPLSLVLLNQRGQVLTVVVQGSTAGAAGLDQSEAVAVFTAVAFVVARDRASLHLGVHQIDNLSIPDDLATVTPSVRATTGASQPQNRFSSSGTAAQGGLNGRTDHIAERHDANWHSDWDRRHAHFFHNRFFVFDDGFWFGLDAGFYPWDYLPYYADDYYPYDYYADDQPYDNTEPVYNGVPAADPTVEATQERLAQLGYYNGPVDGVFGPTTRDAVANYQIANQLNVTGSLSPDTMQSLGLPEPVAS